MPGKVVDFALLLKFDQAKAKVPAPSFWKNKKTERIYYVYAIGMDVSKKEDAFKVLYKKSPSMTDKPEGYEYFQRDVDEFLACFEKQE